MDLDQEKAYDRVHPLYLKKILLRFKFPFTLIDSLDVSESGSAMGGLLLSWLSRLEKFHQMLLFYPTYLQYPKRFLLLIVVYYGFYYFCR